MLVNLAGVINYLIYDYINDAKFVVKDCTFCQCNLAVYNVFTNIYFMTLSLSNNAYKITYTIQNMFFCGIQHLSISIIEK